MSSLKFLQCKHELRPLTIVSQETFFPIYKFNLSNFVDNKQICEDAIKFVEENPNAGHVNLKGPGYKSDYFNEDRQEKFEKLFKEIKYRIYLLNVNNAKHNEFSAYEKFINLESFWIIMLEQTGKLKLHSHSEYANKVQWSSVYYPLVDEDAGKITFPDKGTGFDITPTEGTLLIFPASTYHQVIEHNSVKKRISIVANWY